MADSAVEFRRPSPNARPRDGEAPVRRDMPASEDVADMLRADLDAARDAWIKAGGNPESDFLSCVNHEGEVFDFHSLRHTCGAWLAMAGAHPKAIQTVMRHSSINLTMDTYGHLFPGQEAETVALFPAMLSAPATPSNCPSNRDATPCDETDKSRQFRTPAAEGNGGASPLIRGILGRPSGNNAGNGECLL